MFRLVGLPRVELGSHPPQGCILPLYYSPSKRKNQKKQLPNKFQISIFNQVFWILMFNYFLYLVFCLFYRVFDRALIQRVQALTLLPDDNFTHCKLGYFFCLVVGLYFPLNFFLTVFLI